MDIPFFPTLYIVDIVDLRTSDPTDPRTTMVLEVNAQCGLSFGKNSSSLGEILELSKESAGQFLSELMNHAVSRARG
jgi:hypothetical protein